MRFYQPVTTIFSRFRPIWLYSHICHRTAKRTNWNWSYCLRIKQFLVILPIKNCPRHLKFGRHFDEIYTQAELVAFRMRWLTSHEPNIVLRSLQHTVSYKPDLRTAEVLCKLVSLAHIFPCRTLHLMSSGVSRLGQFYPPIVYSSAYTRWWWQIGLLRDCSCSFSSTVMWPWYLTQDRGRGESVFRRELHAIVFESFKCTDFLWDGKFSGWFSLDRDYNQQAGTILECNPLRVSSSSHNVYLFYFPLFLCD